MAIFKCKMCGGTIEFNKGDTVGICDSCGTKQTLPRLDDDKMAVLYDRADHFRRNNEFDKAMNIYEQILNEDNTDSEAYWSLVLCRYGIEYVEDPETHKRVPTVNRAQYTSIYDDDNYKSALQYADEYQKSIYEEEAKVINDIQKGILAISQQEEPFDVFICYKETDNNGRRTADSVLANDLYHQLTQEGFRVFFARITLEDKLGAAYEPYIFAALNSAKVMVVLGTKPEYFNAVWVKNEWSRYLALVKQSGGKKVLIPAYKDMDPYDLPEEFAHLQAQDMSKLGFMQDLIRGIIKITKKDKPSSAQRAADGSADDISNLLSLAKNAFDMDNLDESLNYTNSVLEKDSTCSEAWIIKMDTAAVQIKKQSYDEYRLREINVCGKNALKFFTKGNADELEQHIVSVYEECLNGYVDAMMKTLSQTSNSYSAYWGRTNAKQFTHDVDQVASAFERFAEISEDVYETPNTLSIILPLYKSLSIRLDISQQQQNRINNPDIRRDLQAKTAQMGRKINASEQNLVRIYPDIKSNNAHLDLPEDPGEMPALKGGNGIGGGIVALVPAIGLTVLCREFIFDGSTTGAIEGVAVSIIYLIAIICITVGVKSRLSSLKAIKEYEERLKKAEEFNSKLNS